MCQTLILGLENTAVKKTVKNGPRTPVWVVGNQSSLSDGGSAKEEK